MHVAIHSYSFRQALASDPAMDIFGILEAAAEMGFRAIEIMAGKAGGDPGHIGPPDLAHLRKVTARAESLGIRIESFSTYNDFAYVKDEAWRLANIAFIKQWLRLAGDTGVRNIRMLSGYLLEGEDAGRLCRLVEDGISECVPVAEEAGVNMAFENHSTVFLSADDILGLIARIGSPRLTTCPDPSNWSPRFFDPTCPDADREMVYESAAKLAPLATASHLKIKGISPEEGIAGFDLDRLLGIYSSAGYNGPIAFESVADGDLLAPLPRAREIVERAIARVTAAKKA